MNYMDRLNARNARREGNARLAATIVADRVDIDRPWAAEVAAMEADNREREMRRLGFGQRTSYCG